MKKYRALLILSLILLGHLSHSQVGGVSCNFAVQVSNGTISGTDNSLGDQWYEYTAGSNVRVTISSVTNITEVDTYVQVYDECGGALLRENNNVNGGTFLSEVTLPVSSGKTIFIAWRNFNTTATFEWSIFEGSPVTGDLCGIPSDASLGTNTTNNAVNRQEEWFRFVPASEGLMTVSNCGNTSIDTKLSVFEECGEEIDFNDDFCSSQSSVTLNASESEDYYIIWEASAWEEFEWTISIEPFEEGQDCSIPTITTEGGSIPADHSSNTSQWYLFTSVGDHVMSLSSCSTTSEDTSVKLYSECEGVLLASSDDYCDTQSFLSYIIEDGINYYVEWSNEKTSSSYTWGLSLNDITDGDNCENAKTASLGSNASIHLDGLSEWFEYTPSEDGVLVVSSCGSTSENTLVQIYDGCGLSPIASNDNGCAEQSLLEVDVLGSTTYYIEWLYREAIGNYNWELSLIDDTGGDSCEESFEITEGAIKADNSTGSEWYKFSLPATSKVEISYCNSLDQENEDTQVNIYNSCGFSPLYSADDECNVTGSKVLFTAYENTEYIVEWSDSKTDANYNWNFIVSEPSNGDICELATQATIGENTTNNFNNRESWFFYTPISDGVMTLSSCDLSEYDSKVTLFKNCGETQIVENDDSCGTQSNLVVEVAANVTYYIKWENKDINDLITWNLTFAEIKGTYCDNPLVADEGINEADNSNGDQWFIYTPEVDGQLTVSSCDLTFEDTHLVIFEDCENPSTVFNDDGCNLQSSTSLFVTVGNSYYIAWLGTYTESSYQWSLTLSAPVSGQVCEKPIKALEGLNPADNSNGTSQWYEFTSDKEGVVSLTTCEITSEDTFVLIYEEGCDGEIIEFSDLECEAEASLSFNVASTETYLIEWSNRFTSGSYNWDLVFESSETDILDFTFGLDGMRSIDPHIHTVKIEVPSNTDVTSLVPTITLSDDATISPTSNVSQDFSSPIVYTVTAEDGITTQEWIVTVEKSLSAATEILSLTLNTQTRPAIINNVNQTILVEVESNTDITSLNPIIEISNGASISPIGPQDFSKTIIYIVTAEDGVSKQGWSVSVEVEEDNPLAVNEKKIKVYPNPTTDVLHVEFVENITSELYKLDGTLIDRKKGDNLTFDLTILNQGIYLLIVKTTDRKNNQYLIKVL